MHPSLPVGWIATLNNGNKFYDWDYETESGKNSWLELSDHLLENETLFIVSLQLYNKKNFSSSGDFAGVTISSPNNEGFFFCKRMSSVLGSKKFSGNNYGIGYLLENKVHITWFNEKVQAIESEIREKEACGFGLIEKT